MGDVLKARCELQRVCHAFGATAVHRLHAGQDSRSCMAVRCNETEGLSISKGNSKSDTKNKSKPEVKKHLEEAK